MDNLFGRAEAGTGRTGGGTLYDARDQHQRLRVTEDEYPATGK